MLQRQSARAAGAARGGAASCVAHCQPVAALKQQQQPVLDLERLQKLAGSALLAAAVLVGSSLSVPDNAEASTGSARSGGRVSSTAGFKSRRAAAAAPPAAAAAASSSSSTTIINNTTVIAPAPAPLFAPPLLPIVPVVPIPIPIPAPAPVFAPPPPPPVVVAPAPAPTVEVIVVPQAAAAAPAAAAPAAPTVVVAAP